MPVRQRGTEMKPLWGQAAQEEARRAKRGMWRGHVRRDVGMAGGAPAALDTALSDVTGARASTLPHAERWACGLRGVGDPHCLCGRGYDYCKC